MIEDAFSYPLEGEEATRSLLIGSAIIFVAGIVNFIGGLLAAFVVGFLLFPIAFLIVLPVYGYLIAVLRTTVQGYDQPPMFQDWETLFVDGLKGILITFVYGFVPSVVFFGLSLTFFGLGGALGDEGGGILGGIGLVVLLLGFFVYLVVAYIVPAALTNFAVEGSVAAAFDFGTIVDVITDGDYILGALVAIVIMLVASVISSVLYVILVGIVVSPVVTFYSYVATARIFAKAYESATADRRQAADSPAVAD